MGILVTWFLGSGDGSYTDGLVRVRPEATCEIEVLS